MYQPANYFADAYQEELLRFSQRLQSRRRVKHTLPWRLRFANRLGDGLIALGERLKIKPETSCLDIPCPEVSRGHA